MSSKKVQYTKPHKIGCMVDNTIPQWLQMKVKNAPSTVPSILACRDSDEIPGEDRKYFDGFDIEFNVGNFHSLRYLWNKSKVKYDSFAQQDCVIREIAKSLFMTYLAGKFNYTLFIEGLCHNMGIPVQRFYDCLRMSLENHYTPLVKLIKEQFHE